jgi:hypothetical protein
VSGLNDRELRGATTSNLKHGAPLGESGSSFVVLFASITKTVKTSGSALIIGTGEDNDTLVDLDAWDDTLRLEEVNECGAVSSLLE